MNWFKKHYSLMIVLLIVGVILISIWMLNRNKPAKKIEFSFSAGGNLSNLLSTIESRYASSRQSDRGIGIYLDVPLNTFINNKSGKNVTMENIAGNISYEGEAIFQTKASSQVLKKVDVNAKSKKFVTDTFQVLINGKTIKFIREWIKGNRPKVDYMMNATILGVPYLFKNSTVINQDQ